MIQSDLFTEPDALQVARMELVANLDEGTLCPVCGRLAKRYRRPLNASLGRFLALLAETSAGRPDGWVHVDREMIQATDGHVARDYSVLRYFDLIEPKPNDEDPRKRTSGVWRLTGKGRRFLLGQIRVPRAVFVFADRREGMTDDSTNIEELMGEGFDYQRLMGVQP